MKRVSTYVFKHNMGKMSAKVAEDNDTFYILVENRKEPQKSFVAMNIEWFLALLESCDVEGIREERDAVKQSMHYLRKRTSRSFRDRVNIRYN